MLTIHGERVQHADSYTYTTSCNVSLPSFVYAHTHTHTHTHRPCVTTPTRADLHRTMNVHTKPPSVTGDDEGAWLGAWPSGRMVGKKGDILKLVSQLHR